jgi:uncharacterized membrane protein YsdA (DUF1294 family)
LVARHVFRHKNRKRSYAIRFWLLVVVNCAVLAWLLFSDPVALRAGGTGG